MTLLPQLRAHVIDHPLMRWICSCGQVHQGSFPEGINAPVQYGPRAKALLVHLNQHHLVPLQRSCALLRDVFGLRLVAQVYFAHPYCSWERGLNENHNGLLRQYFPKKMSLREVT